MLRIKYKLINYTSAYKHLHQDKVVEIQDRFFSALIVGLLNRFIEVEKKNISEKIEYLIENSVWNSIKTHEEFKRVGRPVKGVVDTLVTSTRNLVLFCKASDFFSQDADFLLDSEVFNLALDKISFDLSAEVLEELLDGFMRQEQARIAFKTPDILELARSEDENQSQENFRTLEKLEQDIQAFNLAQKTVLLSDEVDPSEGRSTVASSLSKSIHEALSEVRAYSSEQKRLDEYIKLCQAKSSLAEYTVRPIYKIVLRVRNLLIFFYMKEKVSLSKKISESLIKGLYRLLGEELEILLAIKLFEKISNQSNERIQIVQRTLYPIICTIQNKIQFGLNHLLYPKPQQFPIHDSTSISQEAVDFLSEQVQAYQRIYEPLPEKSICLANIELVYEEIGNALISINSVKDLEESINKILIEAAKEIASNFSKKLPNDKFNQYFFHENSSNPLLEISRRIIDEFQSVSKDEIISMAIEALSKACNFIELQNYLEDKFYKVYNWTVYLPVDGIRNTHGHPKDLFIQANDSVIETHSIKFLSPSLLDSISLQTTTSCFSEPMLISFPEADSCAVIADIQAHTGYEAALNAVGLLVESIESQLFLTDYGHQYQIKPHRRKDTQLFCFCENTTKSSDSIWELATIPNSGWRPNLPFELNTSTEKVFEVSSKLLSILSEQAKENNKLGILAKNLIHSIKLYRKGYFAEEISQRFTLYWTILDVLFSPPDSTGKEVHSIPYGVSLFCLGISNLIEPNDHYTYAQARLWMREDIEDLYKFLRNPLIHTGIEYAPAYERLIERVETIVHSILDTLVFYTVYMPIHESYLINGIEGIISFFEARLLGKTEIRSTFEIEGDTE